MPFGSVSQELSASMLERIDEQLILRECVLSITSKFSPHKSDSVWKDVATAASNNRYPYEPY